MRSAYLVLGVPGNASPEDIEIAFEKAQLLYPKERLVSDEGALARFTEVREAYRVLRDPEMRAAHDRKLAAATALTRVDPAVSGRTVPVVVVEREPMEGLSRHAKPIAAGAMVLALVLGAGLWISSRNAEARREMAAQEAMMRQQEAAEAERRRQEEAALASREDRERSQAEAAERRAAYESRQAAVRATYETRRIESQRAADERSKLMAEENAKRQQQYAEQRAQAQREADERRAAMEARMRLEADKRRLREICLQQYGRPDC